MPTIAESLRIPVWLVALLGVAFLLVVLERLYVAKVPVKIFGIELNQPQISLAGVQHKLETRELKSSGKDAKVAVLGPQADYLFWALMGNSVYRHGASGGSAGCDIYSDGQSWVLRATSGTVDVGIGGASNVTCTALGLKLVR